MKLGIYHDASEPDHDVNRLVDEPLFAIARGVLRHSGIASRRRALRSTR